MKTKLVGIALVLALVVTGGVLGVVVDRTWIRSDDASGKSVDRRRRGNRHDRMMRRFRRRLQLTDEQAAAIDKLLRDSRAKVRVVRKQAREQTRHGIKNVLKPDQLQKYDRMLQRWHERRKGRKGRRGRRR